MMKEVLPARSYRLERHAIVVAIAALTACAVAGYDTREVGLKADAERQAQVDRAADLWNDVTVCTVFGPGADITVNFYTKTAWPGSATERGYWDGSEVAVLETTVEIEHMTLAHEFGHVLGLEHSDDPESVMYPIVGAPRHPTAADARQVDRVFCSR